MVFSEEKNQKTFMSCASGTIPSPRQCANGGKIKVFCFFFSKKKSFHYLLPFQTDKTTMARSFSAP
jgi:hypothetical protein